MKFYTNVYNRGNIIYYLGFENGKRVKKQITYKPYLFIPAKTKQSTYKTVYNLPVEKVDFESINEARSFIRDYKDVANFSIFGSIKFLHNYINDVFEKVTYDLSLLNIVYLDIETKMPKQSFESFVIDTPSEITAISIRKKNEIIAFGFKEAYTPKESNIKYIHCKDERDLLFRFINVITSEHWFPDIITGWNVEFFDITYIINRIIKVLGESEAKRLSPFGMFNKRTVNFRNRENVSITPVGISILDYQQLYMKFTYNQRESYSLNHISYFELGEEKVDYSEYEDLDELYEKDYDKFITYNIQDTSLVQRLEKKLKLIELICTMSYDAKINFTDSLGTVTPWEVVIHNHLLASNIVIPLKKHSSKAVSNEGAYVKNPILGMHEWIVSFDLTSLYPHLIIQYGISPENFVKKLTGVSPASILAGYNKNTSPYSMAANGCLYRKDNPGFLPELMKVYFNKRKHYKDLMKEYKKRKEQGEDVEDKIASYDTAQMAMKIFLNSAYGAVANQYFIFYDLDNAEAITLSGQLSILWIEKHINAFLNKIFKTDNVDYIIAMDTDSMYVNLKKVVDIASDSNFDVSNKDKVADMLNNFAEKIIQPEINKAYNKLAEITNACENAMDMKRESIASKGFWKAKKMYAMEVIDNEGVRYQTPELKITGLEAIRTNIPEISREALKESYKIILSKTNKELIDYIKQFETEFKKANVSDIAFPRGVNGIDKYFDPKEVYTKGTPIHTKGCLIYNSLLRKHKLSYSAISNGDKIKFWYLKYPNPIGEEVIATPGYIPVEFKLNEYIDKDKQFEKTYLEPLRSITNVIGWSVENTFNIEDFYA